MSHQTCHTAPPDGLRINLLTSPFGVDRQNLAFSWIMHGTRPNRMQSAYRILVGRGSASPTAASCLLDTGWVSSDASTGVTIPPLTECLEDDSLYAWSVATRDNDGIESPFSAPQVFSTAVGARWSSTRGLWAVGDLPTQQAEDMFVFLRCAFTITPHAYASLDRAILSATARSPESSRQFVYNLSLNGTSIGMGPSRYGKNPAGELLLFYNSYDVTDALVAGRNCLGAICYALEEKGFLCQLTCHYTDGRREVLVHTGPDACAKDAACWQSLGGHTVFRPSNSIGTPYYTAHANNIDATKYPFGFDTPGFDSTHWLPTYPSIDMAADMRLVPSQTDTVHRYPSPAETIRITLAHPDGENPADGLLLDLGAEIVGGFGLSVTVDEVTDITLTFGEELENGQVKYKMNTGNVYIEQWRLRPGENRLESLDMMCYRYVMITGCPVMLTARHVWGVELRTAFRDQDAHFTCDHTLLQRLYQLTRHTIRVTTQDLYVDSQSRERGAYEGDLLINQLAAYAFTADSSVARFTAEYLYAHRTWPAEYPLYAIMAAQYDYLWTGDKRSLMEWYHTLTEKALLSYFDPAIDLLTRATTDITGTNAILTDWPPSERDGYDTSVFYHTVLNAVAVRAYTDLASLARHSGHASDAAMYEALAGRIRTSMIHRLYRPEQGCFLDGLYQDGSPSAHAAQHATAYALACGVYDSPEMAHQMAAFLAAQGAIKMSVFGAFFLLEGLYATDHAEVATPLLCHTDTTEGARSWAYMLDVLGATVTTEAWNKRNKGNMTLSHPWGAAPAFCITGGIFGIRPTAPGFARFDIRVRPHGLSKAALSMPTLRGCITVAFEATAPGSLSASVTVPCNTQATLYLPVAETAQHARITLACDSSLDTHSNMYILSASRGYVRCELGSGSWRIQSQSLD